ncbi:MAG: hypothetical protein WA144_12230 [Candidatus Methanoperedens sp.]
MEMNPVVHFEMPTKDRGRMRKFYETVFGWQTEQLGKEMGEYAVDDIKEAMKKVKEAGGKVLGGQVPGKPDDIPGVGLYVSFIDTEGNRAGMLQPAPMQSPKE